jgi:hypothetical protein
MEAKTTDRIATARPSGPPWALDWIGYLSHMMGRYRPPRRNSRLAAAACIDHWHAQHAEIVRQAVAAGLPVPAYVLADYPEIDRNP